MFFSFTFPCRRNINHIAASFPVISVGLLCTFLCKVSGLGNLWDRADTTYFQFLCGLYILAKSLLAVVQGDGVDEDEESPEWHDFQMPDDWLPLPFFKVQTDGFCFFKKP